jgi:hypothetical protein
MSILLASALAFVVGAVAGGAVVRCCFLAYGNAVRKLADEATRTLTLATKMVQSQYATRPDASRMNEAPKAFRGARTNRF